MLKFFPLFALATLAAMGAALFAPRGTLE